MRKLLLAAVTGALALGAVSAEAMPTVVVATPAAPAVTLVAGGCGFGFHRAGFVCVPNRRVVVVRRVFPVCVTRLTPFGLRRVCR